VRAMMVRPNPTADEVFQEGPFPLFLVTRQCIKRPEDAVQSRILERAGEPFNGSSG
jgi:hypothetical protein